MIDKSREIYTASQKSKEVKEVIDDHADCGMVSYDQFRDVFYSLGTFHIHKEYGPDDEEEDDEGREQMEEKFANNIWY